MAEKEERILITQWNIKDDICPVPTDFQCGTTKSCADCKVGMSRQEAIRKMCDAYFKAKDKGLMESERVVAALNALLER